MNLKVLKVKLLICSEYLILESNLFRMSKGKGHLNNMELGI